MFRGVLAVAPDHPTRTLTLTLTGTLWGDLCLGAVACEGYRWPFFRVVCKAYTSPPGWSLNFSDPMVPGTLRSTQCCCR